MDKFTISFFLFLSLTLSCTGNKMRTGKEVNYKSNLVLSDTLKFQLDTISSFSPFTLQYLNDKGNEYLFTDNKNAVSLDVYSFNEKKIMHRIEINDSSSLLTDDIHGFWAVNMDSIVVYSRFKMNSILLTLDNWEVINRKSIYINNPITQNSFYNHASMTASPSFVMDNKIYFSEMPMADISQLIGTGYSPEVIYDIELDSSYTSGMTWPKMYQNDKWDDLFLYLKTKDNKGRIIYSWEASHNLVINELDSFYQVPARSDRFDKNIVYDPTNISDEGKDFNRIELNHYMMILFDKYRNVYYRYAISGVSKTAKDGSFKTPFDLPFSIIILDEEFNKIGETYLPEGKFNPKDSFVGKDGLYISDHNWRNYNNLGEDIMSFSLFKLISK